MNLLDDHSQALGQSPDLLIVGKNNDNFISRVEHGVNRDEVRLTSPIGHLHVIQSGALVVGRNCGAQFLCPVALIVGQRNL